MKLKENKMLDLEIKIAEAKAIRARANVRLRKNITEAEIFLVEKEVKVAEEEVRKIMLEVNILLTVAELEAAKNRLAEAEVEAKAMIERTEEIRKAEEEKANEI